MRCYEHHDLESVGVCKACQRGLCESCAAVVDRSLACRSQCEEAVRLHDEALSRRSARIGAGLRVVAIVCAALGAALLLGGYVVSTQGGSVRGVLGSVIALVGVVLLLAAVLWGQQVSRWTPAAPGAAPADAPRRVAAAGDEDEPSGGPAT